MQAPMENRTVPTCGQVYWELESGEESPWRFRGKGGPVGEKMRKTGIHQATRTAWAFVIYLAVGTGLAALFGTALVRWIRSHDPSWGALVLQKGDAKVVVRFMQGLAVLFMPWLLKQAGWQGWKKTGVIAEGKSHRTYLRELGQGVAFGLVTLGPFFIAMSLFGYRQADAALPVLLMVRMAVLMILPALAVGLFEEFLARGVFYGTLSRAWGVVAAAWVTSGFFAMAHFMIPASEPIAHPHFITAVLGVWKSMFTQIPASPAVGLRFLNLLLMSLVLCRLVARSGLIWQAVGAHAAWVWCIKVNAKITDRTDTVSPWFGYRPDSTDAWLSTGMLLLLLLALYVYPRRTAGPVAP